MPILCKNTEKYIKKKLKKLEISHFTRNKIQNRSSE